jgi:hypothetical protein
MRDSLHGLLYEYPMSMSEHDNRKIKKKRGVAHSGPVYVDAKKKIISFQEKKWKLEISKSKVRALLIVHLWRFAAFVMVVVFGSVWFIALPGSARVATFYPETCLGGWENPSHAEGAPDVFGRGQYDTYSSDNSSMNRDIAADMFCGGFSGPVPEDGELRTAVLSFSMYVGDVVEQADGTFTAVAQRREGRVKEDDLGSVQEESRAPSEAELRELFDEAGWTANNEFNADNVMVVEGDLEENMYDIIDADEGVDTLIMLPKDVPDVAEEGELTEDDADVTTEDGVVREETTVLQEEVGDDYSTQDDSVDTVQQENPVESVPDTNEPADTSVSEPNPEESSQNEGDEETVSLWRSFLDVFFGRGVVYATSSEENTDPISPEEPGVVEDETPIEQTQEMPSDESDETVIQDGGSIDSGPQQEEYDASEVSSVENNEVLNSDTEADEIPDEEVPMVEDLDVKEELYQEEVVIPDQDTLLLVEYSFNSVDWVTLGKVSTYDWQTISFELPFVSWENIGDMQVRLVRPLSFDAQPTILLDAMVLDINYDKEKKDRLKFEKRTSMQSFRAGEDIVLEFEYRVRDESFAKNMINELVPVFPYERDFSVPQAFLYDSEGTRREVDIGVDRGMDSAWKAVLPDDLRVMRPGKYLLEVVVKNANGDEFLEQQEFYLGVLTINTNKSIYEQNEEAYIQMGALDDMGHTLCDAQLELEVKDPSGAVEYFSVAEGTIEKSGVCDGDSFVELPDYATHYIVGGVGVYYMRLVNEDTGFEILDSFEVQESVPFVVERVGPTRIYPPATYEMQITIEAKRNFDGDVYEYMPETFELVSAKEEVGARAIPPLRDTTWGARVGTSSGASIGAGGAQSQDTIFFEESTASVNYAGEFVSEEPETKELLWNVSMREGERVTLRYVFDAPDVSPELFLLGPLEFYE